MKPKNNKLCPPSNFQKKESINHPDYYGGQHNTYETIKVIEAWDLNFHLGNVIKYVSRAGKKDKNSAKTLEDLRKAEWYLQRYIEEYQTIKIKKLDI